MQNSVPLGPSEEDMAALGYQFRREGKMVPDGSGGFVEQVIVDPPSSIPTLPPAPKRNAQVTIYFIGPEGGPIKIGMARCVKTRLRDLQLMNAHRLHSFAEVVGTAETERNYHRQFAAHRLHGEWFAPHPDIMAEIAYLIESRP